MSLRGRRSEMTFCFVTSNRYLDRLSALITSIKSHLSIPASYVVLSCEPRGHLLTIKLPSGASVLELDDVIPDHRDIMTKLGPHYHVSGVARVFLVRHLLAAGHKKVVYLDSDMYCYHDLAPLSSLLDTRDSLVTPHITEPYPEDGKSPSMENIVRCGNYNTGFFGARASADTMKFLDWWTDMCRTKADVNYHTAHYSEQNWLRFAGDFIPGNHILRHSGYNLANWNFYQRGLHQKNGKWMTKDGPLHLAHFSSLCTDTKWVSANQNRHRVPHTTDPMYILVDDYKKMFPGYQWHTWNGGWVT